ncbi:MAG: ABC transporter ATP-binding protein [Planctomycetes bacterium]|nr:ABC transporter ATP-binding protein [Planctomycetota bacterium]
MFLLQVDELTKSFRGRQAIRDVSFGLDAGQVLAVIGPVGAGKSTLLRLLAGAIAPDNGHIYLGGRPLHFDPPVNRRLAGYVPDAFGAYRNTTVCEYLDFFANAMEIERRQRRKRIQEVLDFVGKSDLNDLFVSELTRCQAQFVALARGILHDPVLVLLDDPARWLSSKECVEFGRLLSALRDQGKLLILTGRNLGEWVPICSHLALLESAELKDFGPSKGLLNRLGRPLLPATTPSPAFESGRVPLSPRVGVWNFSGPAGDRPMVHDLTFELAAGNILGLVGPNGAGKTTLLRLLAGLLQPERGSIQVDGRPVSDDSWLAQKLVGFMPQRCGAYPGVSIEEFLEFHARARIVIPARHRVKEVLEFTGLADIAGYPMDRMSRFQASRLALALALLPQPSLLLMDEAARGLAPRERLETTSLLRQLGQQGMTLILTARMLTELETVCTHLGLIEAGRLKAFGPAGEIHQEMTRDSRFRIAVGEGYRNPVVRPRPLLEVWEVHKWYGRQHAVQDLTFELEAGQILGFIGPNGAGKTTTIRMLAGLLEPNEGSIYVDGHSVPDAPGSVRGLIGYMPDFFGPYENTSVEEYLDFFAESFGIRQPKRRRLLEEVTELTELRDLRSQDVRTLSRGQMQRVSLARCLMHDPKLLLLDEPASGLDPRARIELRELLKELSRMGKAILISSHILTELEEFCTHFAILNQGRLLAWGEREQVFVRFLPEGLFCVTLADGAEEAARGLRTLPVVLAVNASSSQVIEGRFSSTHGEVSGILEFLVQNRFNVLKFSQEPMNLERLFLDLTESPEKKAK